MKLTLSAYLALTGVSRKSVFMLALTGIVSGAANAALVAIVGETLRHDFQWQPMLAATWFTAASIVYVLLQRFGQARTAHLTEEASAHIRKQLLDASLQASLATGERLDHHYKRLILSRDAAQVAAAMPNIVNLLGSLATVCCALAYLFWLSLPTGAVVCTVIGLAVITYQILIGKTAGALRTAYAENDRAFGFIDDLLLGHKELKLDTVWSQEFVQRDLQPAIEHAARLLGCVRTTQQDISLIGIVAFLILLGTSTFVPPVLGLSGSLMINTMIVLLFIQAHILGIVQRLPGLVEMHHSARRIQHLADTLHQDRDGASQAAAPLAENWQRIHLHDIGYRYDSAGSSQGFQLSGLNLTIERGQTVFIVGGNGSGKTTLAKLIVGLYRPSHGEIRLDGTPITDHNRPYYRQMFNAVFSNVHLFRRRMDGAIADPSSPVRQTLQNMSIRLAVSDDQRLDVRPFSQGQKKRLASALALASEKPLCLFDEWTADQDPEFRNYFHTRYLADLKAAGKTLLVISHDPHYFHHADLIVRMENGRIVSAAPPTTTTHLAPHPQEAVLHSL
jgi:putative pyoverdin transport system ATP-binding/permease protein